MNLENKVAIITGAADGIGKACAMAFAEHGAHVALLDIQADNNAELAATLEQRYPGRCLALTCDLACDEAINEAFEKVIVHFGHCDILLNNAGIIHTGDILELAVDDFDRVMQVNLRAYFLMSQLAAKHMVEHKIEGTIINMSSLNAQLAIPNQVAYVTSKGGIQQLTKATALSLAPHNIRVNAIGPGSVMTKVLETIMHDEAVKQKILSRTPLGRIADPAEIAKTAIFLASDYSSYITGQTIIVDGGRSALNYTM